MTNPIQRQSSGKITALMELCAHFGKQCGMTPEACREYLQTRVFATVTNEKNSRGAWESVSRPMADEDLLSILQAAKRFGIDPLNREIYPYRSRDGRIVPTLSVDGWLHFVNSQPDYDGFEATFADEDVPVPGSKLKCSAWCEVRLFRKSLSHPIVVREYTEEVIRAVTGRDGRIVQSPWQQWPRRMLRHRTFVQAARYAFPCSGLGIVGSDGVVEDEREGDDMYLNDLPPEAAECVVQMSEESIPSDEVKTEPAAVPQKTAPEAPQVREAAPAAPPPKPAKPAPEAERGKAEEAKGTNEADPKAPAEAAAKQAEAIRTRYNLTNETLFRDYLNRTFERGLEAGKSKAVIAQWILNTWSGQDRAFAVAEWNAFCGKHAV